MTPFWVATLENGETVVGQPSWTATQGLKAPEKGRSDWSRLKTRCEDEKLRIRRLSLWVPQWGWFHAPDGKGAYGFFEKWAFTASGKGGCEGLAICWPEGRVVKTMVIHSNGALEMWNRPWMECMVGERDGELQRLE